MAAPKSLSPELRSLRARLGGLATATKYDTKVITAPARRAFLDRFEEEVDPDGVLPEAERIRRAEAAKRLYFTKLAYRSAQSRRGNQS